VSFYGHLPQLSLIINYRSCNLQHEVCCLRAGSFWCSG